MQSQHINPFTIASDVLLPDPSHAYLYEAHLYVLNSCLLVRNISSLINVSLSSDFASIMQYIVAAVGVHFDLVTPSHVFYLSLVLARLFNVCVAARAV